MAQIDIKIQTIADLKAFTDTIVAARGLKSETEKVGHGIGGLRDETDRTLHHIERAFSGSKFAHGFFAAAGIGTGAAAFEHLIEKWGELWKQADEWAKQASEQAEKMAATFERLAKVRLEAALGGMTPERQLELLNREMEVTKAKRDLQEKIRTDATADLSILGTDKDKNQLWKKYNVPMMKGGQLTGEGTLGEAIAAAADAAQLKRVELDTRMLEVNKQIAEVKDKRAKDEEAAAKLVNEAAAGEIKTALSVEDAQKKADAATEASLDEQADKWVKLGDYLLQYRLDLAEIEKLHEKGKFTAQEYARAIEEATRKRDDAQKADINKRLTDFFGEPEGKHGHGEKDKTVLQRSQDNFAGLGDPTQHLQAGQGVQAGLMNTLTQIGTTADQVAAGIESTLGGAVNGITQGINDWITGAKSFGQAMASAANSFLSSMIGAFSRMLAEYTVKKMAMWALDKAIAAEGLLMSAANAAKSLIMWIPAAIAASISSWGIAAVLGTAAVLALVGGKGFAEGGFTDGGTGNVAGVVHGGEWVAPAWMVKSSGFGGVIGSLEAARSGGISSLSRPGYSPQGSGQPVVNILLDPAEFARLQQEHSTEWFQQMHAQQMRGYA